MSTAALDLQSLILNGQDAGKHYADLAGAIADGGLTVRQTVTGASTVDITLADAKRSLLTSAALTSKSRLVLDNAGYTLVSVGKSGARVTLTFEDDAVALLRTHTGTRKAAAGTTTRAGFVTTLIREVPDLRVVVAPGSSKNLVELSRGSGSMSASDSKEDTWTAAGRIMGEIGWRVYCYRGTVTIAPDSWLLAHNGTPFTLSPDSKGVYDIDFQWDTGKPAATATITADAGFRDMAPGSPITLQHMGAANGSWLVETIERTAASKRVTVSAVRPRPTLPEPKDAAAANAAALGNLGIPLFMPDYLGDQATGGASIDNSFTLQPTSDTGLAKLTGAVADKFVQVAVQQRGKPYVYGASGPNAWDCSGFIQDMARRVGVRISKPVSNIAATCRRAGTTLSVEQAAYARGAIIWRQRGGGANDHVVISLGDGVHTIEAMGRAYGVVVGKIAGRDWTGAGWVPGIPVNARSTKDNRPG